MNYTRFLKTEFVDLDLSEVLGRPPHVLLGVSPGAAAQLALLKARTVFDLANATVFNHAAHIVEGAVNPESVLGKHQVVPNEIVDNSAAGIALADLPLSSVRNLVGVGDQNGPGIEAALDVKSIQDLAFWPPFVAARALVAEAYEPYNAIDYDAQSPAELIPRTGVHATQKVIYRKTLLIESKPTTTRDWDGGTLDLSLLDESGFSDVGFGVILTFHQSWAPRRVALGTLLHSLPLGPGESTRMAIVDWARRLAAVSREDINQSENLSSSLEHSTAISEITRATATQTQVGSSGTASVADSQSAGATMFLGLGIGSGSVSSNEAAAATYAVSNTTRSETASALQNIASHTHQNSSLARSKRAAVVTEVSQSEGENITTRTVTNYNHMHALSVQYYEVVQIYETEVRTAAIDRCIFVPMRQVNFRNESNIRKFLNVLIRSALDRRTRDLLLQYRNTVVLEYSLDRFATADLNQLLAAIAVLPPNLPDTAPLPAGFLPLPAPFEKRIQLQMLQSQVNALRRGLAINSEAGFRRGIIEDFDRNDFRKLTIDKETHLNDVSWDVDSGITAVNIQLANGSIERFTEPGTMRNEHSLNSVLTLPIPISDVRGVEVEITEKQDSNPSDFKLFKLHLQLESSRDPAPPDQVFRLNASFVHSEGFSGAISVLSLHAPVDVVELADRLMAHQLYYSQQVWLRADTQALIMQLAPYTVSVGGNELHIVDHIHPRPITVAGNYVAFRFTFDSDKAWTDWLANERKDDRPRYDLIPVPTGGVFCEAVLGEFNSAEKLDATRFWKWQDSPIPFAAPEIAPLETGAHQRIGAPVPGELQTSGSVRLQELPALPEGLATSKEVLGALMAENIFKNMGGVEVTGKLLQAAQAAASAGDTATQQQLLATAKGIMSAFEDLATSFLKSETGVQNITQLGSIVNMLGGSGGSGSGASALSGILGDGSGAAGAAGGAEGVAAAVEAIGPLVAELAPLVLL